ncbi:MAG: hypothetical protein WCS94_08290 [Verrucomicrobiota bacterium]
MTNLDHILKALALVIMVYGLVLLGNITTAGHNIFSYRKTKTQVNTNSVFTIKPHYPNFRFYTDGTNLFSVIYLSETNCKTNPIALLPKL